MINGYEEHMKKIWEAKETVYENFKKSGMKSYADYINTRARQMQKDKIVSDKIFERPESPYGKK